MVSHEVKIMSLNVNGLNSPKKRGLVLTKLKKEKHVIFLQETHLCQAEHEKFKKLGYKNSYYSTYKQSRKRGVMILIPNSTTFVSEKVFKDKEGRYVIVKGKLDTETVTLINVYAPPESKKQFFKTLFNVIATESEGVLICGGDFNITMNQCLDTTSLKGSKKQKSKFVKISLEEMGMMDIWRNLNPLERDFTHYSATHNVHSRIDYFFINKVDGCRVTECIIRGGQIYQIIIPCF